MKDVTAKRLKELRVYLGYSMRSLAAQIDINASSISLYEKGGRKPSVETCYKFISLAKLHGIDVDLAWLRPPK